MYCWYAWCCFLLFLGWQCYTAPVPTMGVSASEMLLLYEKAVFAAALGMLAMYLISCMDYHIFEKYAIAAYLISLALSTLVLFAGNAYNGSRRWLSLGPLSFQPSEFAKLAVILFLARMVGRQKKKGTVF